MLHDLFPRNCVTCDGLLSSDSLQNVCVEKVHLILKFRVSEHNIPCALEKIVMAEVNEDVESCFKTTKTLYLY